jgi:hypothetical protein
MSPVSLDSCLSALGTVERRRLLVALLERNPRRVADLKPSGTQPRQFELETHHVHLPKLVAAGFVDWDRTSHTIRRGPDFESLEPLLKLLVENEATLPSGWM